MKIQDWACKICLEKHAKLKKEKQRQSWKKGNEKVKLALKFYNKNKERKTP